jgi:flagellar biosynthesis GTPase FlhF
MKNSQGDQQNRQFIAWRQREDCGPDMKRPGDADRKSISASDFYPNGFEATRFRRGEADGETMRTELSTALKSPPLNRGAGTAALPYRTAWGNAEEQAGSRGEASDAAVVRGKGDGIPAEDPEVLARLDRKWTAVARHGLEEQRLGQREKEQVARFEEERWAKREQHWLGKFEDQRMAKLEQELPTQKNQQRLGSLGRKQTADQEERRPQASQDGQPRKQLANQERQQLASQQRQQLASQQRQQLASQQRQQLDNQQQLLLQLASQDEQQQELANQDEQQPKLANQDEQQEELAIMEERRLAKLDAGVRKEMQLLQGRAQVTIFLFLTDFALFIFLYFLRTPQTVYKVP